MQWYVIYYHYQDANDGNGYSVLKNYTTNISLPANYDSSDPDSTNRDLINSKKICESESVALHYTYNNNLSYLDRSKKEINCYFDRKLVSVTFDKSDSYVTGVTVAPTDNNSVGSTSITSTTTYKYRYGQEIFMKINGYVNDYMYNEVSCSNSTLCTIGKDGTTKVVANKDMTVKPISKPVELAYKLYNHYQDSNNINGYTILELKDMVKTYAKYLGLDDEKLLGELDDFLFEKTSKISIEDIQERLNCYLKWNNVSDEIKNAVKEKCEFLIKKVKSAKENAKNIVRDMTMLERKYLIEEAEDDCVTPYGNEDGKLWE